MGRRFTGYTDEQRTNIDRRRISPLKRSHEESDSEGDGNRFKKLQDWFNKQESERSLSVDSRNMFKRPKSNELPMERSKSVSAVRNLSHDSISSDIELPSWRMSAEQWKQKLLDENFKPLPLKRGPTKCSVEIALVKGARQVQSMGWFGIPASKTVSHNSYSFTISSAFHSHVFPAVSDSDLRLMRKIFDFEIDGLEPLCLPIGYFRYKKDLERYFSDVANTLLEGLDWSWPFAQEGIFIFSTSKF